MATNFFIDLLERSHRLLTEMEEQNHYEILSYILRKKAEYLSVSMMDILLKLVGRDLQAPTYAL